MNALMKVGGTVLLWAAVAFVSPILMERKTAEAYSYTSFEVNLRDHFYHYGYHQTTFHYGTWSGNFTALQSVRLSSRIVGPSYSYNGWNLGGTPSWVGADFPAWQAGTQTVNHTLGWRTVERTGFGDLKDLGYGITVWGSRCNDANYCGTWILALGYGATIKTGSAQGYSYGWMKEVYSPYWAY